MSTPQVLSRKANGVLPVAAAQAAGEASKPAKTKVPVEGEKVVIRRLPPGLTEDEFLKVLSEDWKAGNGKVDWFSYKAGKISQDPSKPSRPSRAYLHVKKRDDLMALSEAVRTSVWEDSKETWTSPSLIGPPTTEFAIYKKVPSAKRRNDGRQGTIDQDQEFMDFLEALANPAATQKDGENDEGGEETTKSEVKTKSTPLIEYLREKKASKAKEAANAKSAKHGRQESQGGKGKASAEESKKKSKESKDKAAEKPKETVKILTKKQAADAAAEAAKAVAGQLTASTSQEAPKSRRAGIAAAARILERDLGLSPGTAHRRARIEAAKQEAGKKAEADTKSSHVKDDAAVPPASTSQGRPPTPTAPKSQTQQPAKGSRGKKGNAGEPSKARSGNDKSGEGSAPASGKAPVVLLKKKDDAGASAQAATGSPSTPAPPTTVPPTGPKSGQAKSGSGSQKKGGAAGPSPGATRAFVKHANPSQGVTETVLKEAMAAFGSVTFVEIDRRKGFAYVDFADHSGLAKAIAANPVPVAQATVQVLERKDPPKKAAAPAAAAASGPATGSASASSNVASTPAVAAEKASTGGEHKRSGRRRGGRGKDGGARDAAKEAAGGSGSKNADQSTTTGAGPSVSQGTAASSSAG